jgi:ABC-type multidrug transport system fused ATPase/permease subunit
VERIFELMNESVEVADVPNAVPLNVQGGEVVFDRVSFTYDREEENSENILQDISFKVIQ